MLSSKKYKKMCRYLILLILKAERSQKKGIYEYLHQG